MQDQWGGYVFDTQTGSLVGATGVAQQGNSYVGPVSAPPQEASWTATPGAQVTLTSPYSTSSGPTAADLQQAAYINKAFDSKLANYGQDLRALDPQEQAAGLRVVNQYQTKRGDLDTSKAVGQRNLTFSRGQVEGMKSRSLRDIKNKLLQQSMSYANQLGVYGAGDSSAAPMIQQALSGKASQNRGDVMQNASGQLTQIQMQEDDLNRTYETAVRDLDGWKQSSLAELATSFAQQRQAIRNAMATAEGEKLAQLAALDSNLTQAALESLGKIEAEYRRGTDDIVNRYQNMFAPQNVAIPQHLQQYAVRPVDPGVMEGLRMPPMAAADPASGILRRREDEEANQIVRMI